jgi:hypothetical protein
MMKLQKNITRKKKGKVYQKWSINIPQEIITKLGWRAGFEISMEIKDSKLLLQSDANTQKIIIKNEKKDVLTFYERFAKVYTNLPLPERKLPIIVINGEPLNWHQCNMEITGKTELGKKIGAKLIELEII